MPVLSFSAQSYSRPGFRVPSARLENMYCEATPAGPGKEARYPRPTLATGYTIGTGPIRGMFYGSGVVGGYKFAVSGTQLYKDATLIGSVTDGDKAQFAGSSSQLGVVIGGDLWVTNGASLNKVLYFKEYATATLTLTGNALYTQTVTLGSKTYTFVNVVGELDVANRVLIGANASASIDNLIAAINAGTGAGTVYGTGTTVNTAASAAAGAGDTMVATAKVYNTINPAVPCTDTLTNGSWSSATLGNLSTLPYFTGITYTAGRFYLIVRNSDSYYWSDIDDLTLIDALSFASAESAPDYNVAVSKLSDEIWFFGRETVEPWYQTGQSDSPLQRSQGRRYEKGCAAENTIVAVDNTLMFVGNDHLVYRSGDVPLRISTHSIEAAIERCDDISEAVAYPIWFGGHSFYVLNIPGVGTFAYDISTGTWGEWTSYGLSNFIPTCSVIVGDVIYLGSSVDGKVYVFAQGDEKDAGETVTFLASAFLPLPTGKMINFSLMLQGTRGLGVASGLARPVVQMRYSDDAGQTWSDWRAASLGMQGQYSFKAIWRCLGQVNSPGRVFEFRTTDAVPIVYEFVTFNEGTP